MIAVRISVMVSILERDDNDHGGHGSMSFTVEERRLGDRVIQAYQEG